MAITKTNRSVHPSKANQPRTHKERPAISSNRNRVRFPEVRGRVVQFVEFFSDPSTNTVHLRFQDNTSLTFDFATSFAMEAYFSRWKSGNERVLRYWPRIKTEPIF